MTIIEMLARADYSAHAFDQTRRWNIYLAGYQDGYRKALAQVAMCLTKPNNLERIESINNLIEQYGNEGCEQEKEEAGDGHCPAHHGI